ncbi:HD domain-containing protein [Microbulbifer sp. SAOS-129_SWC]|uniref:HD domain-containing protein n=1 Tax=Microbulbifer sp. SAOS-129_SWC TaxID=3145235 RepID=UPI0032178C4E
MTEQASAEIEQILGFIVEIEKLKAVIRKTRPVGLDRYENSAEHSWHVCLAALMLKDYADEAVDIDRVIRMLLIHDLGEIDAGDKIIYQSETEQQKAREAAGVKRLLELLPGDRGEVWFALWQEFERGDSADARFARAIDRVPPLLHNLHGGGHSWREHGISKTRVLDVNSRIGAGSSALWAVMREKLLAAAEDGTLP